MRTLWCLWLAATLGMPYLLGFAEPAGVVSYAGAYGFACAGMLAGLWLVSHPTLSSYLGANRRLFSGLFAVGLCLTIIICLFELVRAIILAAVPIPQWATFWNTFARPFEKPAVFFAALLCGMCASRFVWPCAKAAWPHVATVLAYFAGLTRAAAWSLLLPRPAYPLPATDLHLSPLDYWPDNVPFVLGAGITLACMFAWAYVATHPQTDAPERSTPSTLVALCLGELSWRFAGRVVPSLLEISMPAAIGTLCVHILCLGITVLISTFVSRQPQKSVDRPEASEASSKAPLPSHITEYLIAQGLTSKELDVLGTALIGLSSSQAAEKLGIQPSTVRTYRTRICKKLGAENIDEVALRIAHSGQEAPMRPDMNAAPGRPVVPLLGIIGSASLLVLMLMPYHQAANHWDSTWIVPCGAALGLLAPYILKVSGHHASQRVPSVARTLMLGASILLTTWCYSILAKYAPYGPPPTLVKIGTILGVAACTAFASNRLYVCLHQLPNNSRSSIYAPLYVALIAVLSACETSWWTTCVAVSGVLTCLSAALNHCQFADGSEKKGTQELNTASLLTLACFAAFAFAWEEAWRGSTYASPQYCGAVFLVLVGGANIHRLKCHGQAPAVMALAISLATTVSLAWLATPMFGLIIGTAITGLALATTGTPHVPQEAASTWHTPRIAACFGICSAIYAANAWDTIRHILGSSASFDATIGALLVTLFSALGILHLARSLTNASHSSPDCTSNLVDEKAAARCLQGRGLTPTQADVMVCTARGLSVKQTAQKLSYSRSAVHQIRAKAFDMLAITNSTELVALIQKECDVQKDRPQ